MLTKVQEALPKHTVELPGLEASLEGGNFVQFSDVPKRPLCGGLEY